MEVILTMSDDSLNGTAPTIASEETREKFEEKMRALRDTEIEKQIERRAADAGVSYVNLVGFPIAPEALELVPKEVAARLRAVCFLNTGTEIRVGAVEPAKPEVKELLFQIQERTRSHGAIYQISEKSFAHAHSLYDRLPQVRKIVKGIEIGEAELKKFQDEFTDFAGLEAQLMHAPTTERVSRVIAAALRSQASDVHIEGEQEHTLFRFRLDGVLQDVARLPAADGPQLVSRLKLVAGLKINITDRPQDGRFTITLTKDAVDVRVSTLPTAFGESVVMRILRAASVGLQFDDIGVRGRAFEQLKREVERPNGMILTTGPTGSGKTTTLYAILTKLRDPKVKIITLEDPIEYRLEGINQSQIDPSKEYTFGKGLRAILRQDPDVVMVGEIRDLETADIAIQAALTGHLVLSTIHTNSASGAIPRFLALGVKPFLLAPAINAIVGQRLVRKVCAACVTADKLDEATWKRVQETLSSLPKDVPAPKITADSFKRGDGCKQCFGLGYRGRIGIYEIFTMNKEIEGVILAGNVSEYVMADLAHQAGMVTMVQDGILKAADGITTVEEVFRVAE